MPGKGKKSKVIAFAPLIVPQSMIQEVSGISKTTVLAMEKKGTFPKRRKIPGQKRNGWALRDIQNWANGLPFVGDDENDFCASN